MNITREPCESAGCSRNVSFEFRKGTCVVPITRTLIPITRTVGPINRIVIPIIRTVVSDYPCPHSDYPLQC